MSNITFDPAFWSKKNVFLTGHTGFKGSWLSLILSELGANVCGYALPPHTQPNLYSQLNIDSVVNSTIADIRNRTVLKKTLLSSQPEIVIHMAAQPLVISGYKDPIETYDVNVMGTASLLDAARSCGSIKALLVITTDKCYQNNENNHSAFIESDPMGGLDPYSSSKACCELLTHAFHHSYFEHQNIGVATARAGNVVGGGDWASHRLIPDLIRSIQKKDKIKIRYPHAVRPWQHVLDALNGYILLTQALYQFPQKYSGSWNFGPGIQSVATVSDVINFLHSEISDVAIDYNKTQYHEASFLALDSSKAQQELGWQAQWDLPQTLKKVANWYLAYLHKEDLLNITKQQIQEYRIN